MDISPVDILILALLLWRARVGFQQGFTDVVWSTLHALLVATSGTAASIGLVLSMTHLFSPPPAAANLVALVVFIVLSGLAVELLRRSFGDRLSAADPLKQADPAAGLLASMMTTAAWILVLYSVLHPFPVSSIDWNPMHVNSEAAVHELFSAILGTLRSAILEDSWLGRMAVQHLHPLLLPIV